MIVSITGTRLGLQSSQYLALEKLLLQTAFTELHHGDCKGADESAHEIALISPSVTSSGAKIVIHPPEDDSYRAFCQGAYATCEPLPYLTRNHFIAACADVLVAMPDSPNEKMRSGTWATVRYARALQKLIIRINPDGSVALG